MTILTFNDSEKQVANRIPSLLAGKIELEIFQPAFHSVLYFLGLEI